MAKKKDSIKAELDSRFFFGFFFNGMATDRFSEMRSGVAISSLFFLQVTEFFSPSKREREKSDEPTAKEENKKKTG